MIKKNLSCLIIAILVVGSFSTLIFGIDQKASICLDTHSGALDRTRVSKPNGAGPYSVEWEAVSIPRPSQSSINARIYFPSSGGGVVNTSDAPYPGLVFAPGAGGYETDYVSWMTRISSWGYIACIVGTGGGCDQNTVDIQSYALDYFDAANISSSSTFYGMIDTNSYGGTGHSNGGWTAIAGGVADQRFKAIGTLSAAAWPSFDQGQGDPKNLHVPLQLLAGSADPFKDQTWQFYNAANPVRSAIIITGATHSGPFMKGHLISFFKFWLDGERDYFTFIYGDEMQQDINSTIVSNFKCDLSSVIRSSADKTAVEEDETVTFSGQVIYEYPADGTTLYEWDFDGDGIYDWNSTNLLPVDHSYESNGDYEATFRIANVTGHKIKSVPISISVTNRAPTADAGEDMGGYEDHAVQFNASNSSDTPSDVDGLWYQWDYGDGTYSDWLDHPGSEHTYTENGVYTVQVSVRDDDDAEDNNTINVTIDNVAPICSIIVDTETPSEDQEINFAAVGNDTASDIYSLTYYWDFGDDTGSDMANPAHTYTETGTYTVNLSVMDDDSAIGYSQTVINVSNIVPSCTGLTKTAIVNEDDPAEFSGQGFDSDSDKSSLVFSWDFGDGNSTQWASSATSTHIYEDRGEYTATFTVKDNDEDVASSIVNISVENVPPTVIGEADETDVDEDSPVVFDVTDQWDTISDIDGLTFTWDFGDGIIAQGARAVHSYPALGAYSAEVTAVDDDGAAGAFLIEMTVNNVAPTAMITSDALIGNLSHEFMFDAGLSSDTPSDLINLTYEWSFGEGSAAMGVKVNHTFSEVGEYWVSLIVSDSDATATAWVGVTVTGSAPPDDDVVENNDTDGDGLSDDWEIKHFNDLTQGPNDDYDNDSFSNLEEMEAMTDPADETSFPGNSLNDNAGSEPSISSKSIIIISVIVAILLIILVVALVLVFARKKSKPLPEAEERSPPATEKGINATAMQPLVEKEHQDAPSDTMETSILPDDPRIEE